MSSETGFSQRERIIIVVLSLLMMGLTTVAVVPSLRNEVKALFSREGRQVLAKVSAQISAGGIYLTVFKISTPEGLSLEVFTNDEESKNLVLLARIPLEEKRDAFFSFQGNATNLALTDVDADGVLEILAPTYDDQMIARLNVYKYNPDTKSFDRMASPPTGN